MPSGIHALTLGDIVAADYRAAAVFDHHDLDFCCGGRRSVEEACREKGVEPGPVVAALERLTAQLDATPDAAPPQELDDLATYIVRRHHTYVREALPTIADHLERTTAAHGARHPELARVADHFNQIDRELQMHMMKEEQVLFPYIREMSAACRRGMPAPPNMFGTVRNPIRMMEEEHKSAGNEMAVIRELTGGYQVPGDGCATYRACLEELQAFDRDLRLHIHLENNVLFPRAAALETELMSSGRPTP